MRLMADGVSDGECLEQEGATKRASKRVPAAYVGV
jgi:hypothetical protein